MIFSSDVSQIQRKNRGDSLRVLVNQILLGLAVVVTHSGVRDGSECCIEKARYHLNLEPFPCKPPIPGVDMLHIAIKPVSVHFRTAF